MPTLNGRSYDSACRVIVVSPYVSGHRNRLANNPFSQKAVPDERDASDPVVEKSRLAGVPLLLPCALHELMVDRETAGRHNGESETDH